MIQENILDLVDYGLVTGLVEPADKVRTHSREFLRLPKSYRKAHR